MNATDYWLLVTSLAAAAYWLTPRRCWRLQASLALLLVGCWLAAAWLFYPTLGPTIAVVSVTMSDCYGLLLTLNLTMEVPR